eukprot:3613621-Pleurochrysis_carterae.AAC.1
MSVVRKDCVRIAWDLHGACSSSHCPSGTRGGCKAPTARKKGKRVEGAGSVRECTRGGLHLDDLRRQRALQKASAPIATRLRGRNEMVGAPPQT